jgi:hypothetical protein
MPEEFLLISHEMWIPQVYKKHSFEHTILISQVDHKIAVSSQMKKRYRSARRVLPLAHVLMP